MGGGHAAPGSRRSTLEGALLRAGDHLERALSEPVSAAERGSLLRELGEILHAVDPPRAAVHLAAAAEAVDSADEVADIRWTLSKAKSYSGDLPAAVEEIERAAAIAPDLDRRRTLAAEAFLWRRLSGLDRAAGLKLLRTLSRRTAMTDPGLRPADCTRGGGA